MWKETDYNKFVLNLPNSNLYLTCNDDINQWSLRIESDFLPEDTSNHVLKHALDENSAKAMAIIEFTRQLTEKQNEIQKEIDTAVNINKHD